MHTPIAEAIPECGPYCVQNSKFQNALYCEQYIQNVDLIFVMYKIPKRFCRILLCGNYNSCEINFQNMDLIYV